MNTDSFTDEQLLNLLHSTIQRKTSYDIEQYTGGSIQLTCTHKGTKLSYRLSLYFGYKGKHPITVTLDIDEELIFIWTKSLYTKMQTMKIDDLGMDYNELNSLMNTPCIVVSNKVISPSLSKGTVPPLDSNKIDKEFSITLSGDVYKCYSYEQLEDNKTKIEYQGATDRTFMVLNTNQFNKLYVDLAD